MKKLITLIAVLSLIGLGTPVFSMGGGGEGENTDCNGEGNENSPCDPQNNGGQGGKGGKGGNSTIKNSGNSTIRNSGNSSIESTIRNNIENNTSNSNDQSQNANANNEGVNVDASDNSSYSYEEVPQVAPTFPMKGTTSFTFSTPVGGGGFSKDSKDAKLISAGSFIQQVRDAKLLDEDDAKEATLNIVNKLLKRACGRSCVLQDEESSDKEVTENGGNL